MEKLIEALDFQIAQLEKSYPGAYDLSDDFLDNLHSVFPFNKFEYIISHLLARNVIHLEQYLNMRSSYLGRNKYLHLFEITAPRTFGETWAQRHLNELVQELELPSTKQDSEYKGQYDFWYKGIRIEVKASRAVKRKSGDSLIIKALSTDSKEGYDMNFQQIKPDCCDVFVWIAVWRDAIKYWVLSSKEVAANNYFSKGQHRGNTGEGQLWIKDTNISEFEQYLATPRELLDKIIKKSEQCAKDKQSTR